VLHDRCVRRRDADRARRLLVHRARRRHLRFGDAAFKGSTGDVKLAKPIVGMAPTPTGKGYWFTATDGGVFAFGDASFLGSAADKNPRSPIVAFLARR
jgi:hypothetical protein